MRIKYFFLAFAFLNCIVLSAQTDSSDIENEDEPIEWIKPSDNEKTRLGIIMGMQMCGTPGGEISNFRPMVGLLAGSYGRINFKKGWSLQQGVLISFRGSNYKSYARIKVICLSLLKIYLD
jgi:hypothetical protein